MNAWPPRFLLLGLASVLALAGCGGRDDGRPPDAILITLDTTNASALTCYGGPAGITPRLDQLAAEGVRFAQARSVAPLTTPSHASILTGLYPPRHGVRDNAYRALPASASTLAERAREAGYQTAAFLSAVVLAAPYGLDQGFDVYEPPGGARDLATAHMVERDAEAVTASALTWLRGRDRSRPFFLWVHYFDPHAPYEPPARFLRQARGNPYLGEVSAMDAAVGTLLDALRSEDVLDDAVVVAVADHGESLGAHGEPTHSILCYEEVLHVPLILRLPGGRRAGEVVDDVVSVADVHPTLLAALGLGGAGDVDGVSLLAPASERGVYFESYAGYLNHGWCPLTGWLDGGGKYVHGTTPELLDWRADPRETRNLLPAETARAAAYAKAIGVVAEGEALAPDGDLVVDDDMRAGVRALGYAGSADPTRDAPHPLEDTGLPDPRDRMDELARFYEATLLFNQGQAERAIEGMRAVLAGNPGNVAAASVLASFHLTGERFQEAIDVLLALPAEARDRLNVLDYLGHAYEGLGARESALAYFRDALALKPGDPHQAADVARLERALGGD